MINAPSHSKMTKRDRFIYSRIRHVLITEPSVTLATLQAVYDAFVEGVMAYEEQNPRLPPAPMLFKDFAASSPNLVAKPE